MLKMIISNPTRYYVFFNRQTNLIHNEIYGIIDLDKLKNANLKAHEKNISLYCPRPDEYSEVIEGIIPIPPRSRWDYDGKRFHCINHASVSSNFEPDFAGLISICKRLLSVNVDKKIAVELSGGLDTAIIIGLLEHLGVSPFLVGIRSSRYEFRTESYIQDSYKKMFKSVNLIDDKEALPFKDLQSAPLHQLPSSTSLYYKVASRIAEECHKEEMDIVYNGMGFDALLCDHPNSSKNNTIPNSWHSWMLDDNWLNEHVYHKYNLAYISAAASSLIVKSVWALRQNQGEDAKKWWGRSAFKEMIPNELVNYAYKADNSGKFLDGLYAAENDISKIFNTTYSITKFKEFSPSAFSQLFDALHLADENKDKLILARLSFATWIYGLAREHKINI